MDPSSQQSRLQCETCHKFFANTLSLKVHSKNCRRCSICKKLFSGTRYKVRASTNFQTHVDLCIRRALTNPPAMGPDLNNPPAMCGESGLSTLPGSVGKHGDAGLEKTSDMDPLGQLEADDGLNTAMNSKVDLQSSASIQSPFVQQHDSGVESTMKSSTGFNISPLGVSRLDRMILVPSAHISGDIVHTKDGLPDIQALGCSGNHVEKHTPVGLLAPLNLSGPQFHKKQSSQQPKQQTNHHMFSPGHNLEIGRDLQLGEQSSLMESLHDSIPSRKLPNPKRQRLGVQNMVRSSSQLSLLPKGLTPSERMLPVPSLESEDNFGGGVPQIQASVGIGNHVEERPENMGMAHVNQVGFNSSVRMPLPLIQLPSSGVKDMEASSSQSIMPAERVLPAGLPAPSPPQSDHQNIFCGGNEVSLFQASSDRRNHVDETLENVDMAHLNQLSFNSYVSVPSPQMQPNSGAQDTAASLSQSNILSQGLTNTDRMLLEEILEGLQVPSPPQSDHQDILGGGNEVPPFQASADGRNHLEETLENVGMAQVNQVNFDSYCSMPLSQMQPSSGAQDMATSLSQSNIFSQGLWTSERMLLAQLPMLSPRQSDHQDIFGGGNEMPCFQDSADSRNYMEATLENPGVRRVNRVDFGSSISMPLPQMQPSSGAQDMATSLSQSNIFSQSLSTSERILPAGLPMLSQSQSSHQDIFGGGNEMPRFQADSRNYMEAILENPGVRHVNQVDFGSPISMPLPLMQPSLGVQDMAASSSPFNTFPEDHMPSEVVVPVIRQMSLIQQPSSRVSDKMVAFNAFPPGIRPLDRMFPVPYQHVKENTWGAGDDSCADQDLGGSGKKMEAIKEEGNMQQVNQLDLGSSHNQAHNMPVGMIHGNSSEVPHIMASGAALSGGQGNQGEGDNNNDTTSTGDEWLWSDSLWNWS